MQAAEAVVENPQMALPPKPAEREIFPSKSNLQRRFDRLTAQKKDAERERDHLRGEVSDLETALARAINLATLWENRYQDLRKKGEQCRTKL